MGVLCREVPDTDADFQWYEFVARGGYAAIRIADTEGGLEVLATTEDLDLADGEQFTVEAACVDDEDGRAQLWMTVDDTLILQATHDEPLGNGVSGLQAYDAPASASSERLSSAGTTSRCSNQPPDDRTAIHPGEDSVVHFEFESR